MDKLPEACIVNVLAFLSPGEACRLSTLSSMFKLGTESDALWEKFLPKNYKSIIESSSDPSLMERCPSKKDLYMCLSDNLLLIDRGLKSISLEKFSGKAIYMIFAKELTIVWSDTPSYWRWFNDPQSRFTEVAELVGVCWLEIRGKINTNRLSKRTLYGAYFVFQFTDRFYGFEDCPVEVSVRIGGRELSKKTFPICSGRRRGVRGFQRILRNSFLPRYRMENQVPMVADSTPGGVEYSGCMKNRGDGWFEVELGDFLRRDDSDGEELEMAFVEVEQGCWKGGLRVQGIEIRPKKL